MEGDFTRSSDDPAAAYSGVLMQQGRVQLDADWNEQWAIQIQALRAALRDLIGRHGGPAANLGFQILGPATAADQALRIGTGAYYVDGIRCEQRLGDATLTMVRRPAGNYLVFLDVWERHVNAIEDPQIREIALLGPDTATRAQVLYRVRLLSFPGAFPATKEAAVKAAEDRIENGLRRRPRRRLAARAQAPDASTDPCLLSPLAGYRGRENQLYRVQIHDAWPEAGNAEALFTFKWSRDNGSVVFPIVRIEAPESPAAPGDHQIVVTVQVGHLGRDERYGLVANDIVEFVHDAMTREAREALDDAPLTDGGRDPGRPGLLGRVLAPIDPDDLTLPIAVYTDDLAEIAEGTLHPYLRRWDQRDTPDRKLRLGAIPVTSALLDQWLPLEDGVEIRFEAQQADDQLPLQQRSGDYWLLPARTATGDLLWPTLEAGSPPVATPQPLPPHGPHRHYAPLAVLSWTGTSITATIGVRKQFAPLATTE